MIRFRALVLKELLVLSKDKHGLFVLFAMPAIFILIMSWAMRDAFSPVDPLTIRYLIVNRDAQPASRTFEALLQSVTAFSEEKVDAGAAEITLEEIRRRVSAEEYKFALVIPAGFSERIAAKVGIAVGRAPTGASAREDEPLLNVIFSPSVLPQPKSLFLLSLRQAVLRLMTRDAAARIAGFTRRDPAELLSAFEPNWIVAEEFAFRGGSRTATVTSVQQNVPAWLVFAMFFVVIPISTVLIVEKQQGSLVRLRIVNVSGGQLLGAKIVPYYLVNMTQLVIMLAVGVWGVPLLGGDTLTLGRSWIGLWMIGSATSFAGIGLALLISTLAKTNIQATMVGGVLNLVFGALGGIMVPKVVMPEFMQTLTIVSPMSWGLEGFWDILLRQGDWHDALPEAAGLTAFGAVALALASLLFGRMYRL